MILTWKQTIVKKDLHPKTAGLRALNQKFTLKHLLFTLAIFTGRQKESETGDSHRRYTGEDLNLAHSLNGPFYRKQRD